jgi:serine-type D-Ala-D-Ala carboxypeptidase/endopeptidase (penicillin-binding protein 4)
VAGTTRRSRPSGSARGSLALRWSVVIAVLGVAAIVVATLVVFRPDEGRSPRGAGTTTPSGSSQTPPQSGPGLTLQPPPPAGPVLAATSRVAPVSVARLQKRLAPLLATPALTAHLSFAVSQLGASDVHWSSGPASTMPASTLKLLTATAALAALGPEHRFPTTVVEGTSRRSLVLVGGGDPLLASSEPDLDQAGRDQSAPYPQRASLEALAAETASRLAAEGVRRVRLGYDTSLFSGPAVNPRWPTSYIPENVVSPISALWVEEGRENAGYAQRSPDPALAAAQTFRSELIAAGITVVGDPVEQSAPQAGGRPVAAVESAPLEQIVQHVLEDSDNEGAEVLLRQVALARGLTGSSANGVTAVRAVLHSLGLDLRGARLYDGSGLSRDDVLPVALLVETLETDANGAHPELRGVLTGLPVAGFSGTLAYRLGDDASAGLGYVRAKTGTLTGVQGLAGIAMTRDGAPLVFVAVANEVPVDLGLQARADLDAIAAGLATCGC